MLSQEQTLIEVYGRFGSSSSPTNILASSSFKLVSTRSCGLGRRTKSDFASFNPHSAYFVHCNISSSSLLHSRQRLDAQSFALKRGSTVPEAIVSPSTNSKRGECGASYFESPFGESILNTPQCLSSSRSTQAEYAYFNEALGTRLVNKVDGSAPNDKTPTFTRVCLSQSDATVRQKQTGRNVSPIPGGAKAHDGLCLRRDRPKQARAVESLLPDSELCYSHPVERDAPKKKQLDLISASSHFERRDSRPHPKTYFYS